MGTPFVNPIVLAFGAKSFPPAVVPRVIGVWGSVSTLSQAAGVMAGATALKATGNYHLSLWIVSIVALFGFLVALFTPGAAPRIRSLEHSGSREGFYNDLERKLWEDWMEELP